MTVCILTSARKRKHLFILQIFIEHLYTSMFKVLKLKHLTKQSPYSLLGRHCWMLLSAVRKIEQSKGGKGCLGVAVRQGLLFYLE